MLIVTLPGGTHIATALAAELGAETSDLASHHFPDGEHLVRLLADVNGRDVVFAGSIHPADEKTLPLLFAAETARELGAKRIGLVTPYLPYMRQDARFRPGEAITSISYARLLSGCLDFLVTVDPHLHRWHSLSQIYTIPTEVVAAAPAIAQWVKANVTNPLLVGPDEESRQWAAEVARLAGAPCTVLTKQRRGDRDVSVTLEDATHAAGHTPVLVDDIISTGRTIAAAAQALKRLGLSAPLCVAVHAVFADDAVDAMTVAGVQRVVTCDTIPHPTNAIPVAHLVAPALRRMLAA
ncbi:ribose-phosphate pyrophosphokinase [Ramlibacter albus]|uniref:Ribose-phosphate pyrophosphokinase n=1 Tax=Ramlibacter albus TaxID=2079448 RepID=A0A923MBR1_9BURK|nr:ribose-phosphate pyrophosphokinase [Ramlibacter albus]MBC5766601.1 ribose-phosphate pyrophosphokinase [Ramlibacter albus]